MWGSVGASKRRSLFCQVYKSSVHRRRYSAFAAGNGRGGKLDLGNRSVDDHDARRTRVALSILASRAGWRAADTDVEVLDIFQKYSGDCSAIVRG